MYIIRNIALMAALLTPMAAPPAASQPAASQPAASQPAASQDVWHATQTLLPGDIVRSTDVIAQKPTRVASEAVPATTEVVGLEIKRRVYTGHELTARDIGPRSAVKANTDVGVLWKSGDLALELKGRALETGALGEEIRVLNPSTSRTIRGTIVGNQMVEVRSQP